MKSYLSFWNKVWPSGSFSSSARPTPLIFGQDLNSIKRQLQGKAFLCRGYIVRDGWWSAGIFLHTFLNLFIIIDIALGVSVAHILFELFHYNQASASSVATLSDLGKPKLWAPHVQPRAPHRFYIPFRQRTILEFFFFFFHCFRQHSNSPRHCVDYLLDSKGQ